jgi:hypothetical protein
MSGRKSVLVWVGSGLAVAGLAALLVAWLGLNRANEYLGVPAAVAAFIGLVVSAYGVFGARPAERVEQTIEDSEIRGNNMMIGRLGSTRGDEGGVPSGPGGTPEPSDPGVSQVVRRTKIDGDNAIVGKTASDVDFEDGA